MGHLLNKGLYESPSKEEKNYREQIMFPVGWSGLPKIQLESLGAGGKEVLVRQREAATVVALLELTKNQAQTTIRYAESAAESIKDLHEESHGNQLAMLRLMRDIKKQLKSEAKKRSSSSKKTTKKEPALEMVGELIKKLHSDATELAEGLSKVYKGVQKTGVSMGATSQEINATHEIAMAKVHCGRKNGQNQCYPYESQHHTCVGTNACAPKIPKGGRDTQR